MQLEKKDYILLGIGILIVLYTIVFGLTIKIPLLPVIGESIRNLFYHVAMWVAMFAAWLLSFVYSILYLKKLTKDYEIKAFSFAKVGMLFGLLGIVTGMIWAKFSWGKMWINDPKLNGAAISIFAYYAYLIIRKSSVNKDLLYKITSMYNIMSFTMMLVLILIMPRVVQYSIHPGSNDGQSFVTGGMDFNLQIIFFPSFIGWLLIGWFIFKLQYKLDCKNSNN